MLNGKGLRATPKKKSFLLSRTLSLVGCKGRLHRFRKVHVNVCGFWATATPSQCQLRVPLCPCSHAERPAPWDFLPCLCSELPVFVCSLDSCSQSDLPTCEPSHGCSEDECSVVVRQASPWGLASACSWSPLTCYLVKLRCAVPLCPVLHACGRFFVTYPRHSYVGLCLNVLLTFGHVSF